LMPGGASVAPRPLTPWSPDLSMAYSAAIRKDEAQRKLVVAGPTLSTLPKFGPPAPLAKQPDRTVKSNTLANAVSAASATALARATAAKAAAAKIAAAKIKATPVGQKAGSTAPKTVYTGPLGR